MKRDMVCHNWMFGDDVTHVTFTCMCLLCSPSNHAAREKVALLIGNQRYDNLHTLQETEAEIMKLAKKLEEVKFKVCNHNYFIIISSCIELHSDIIIITIIHMETTTYKCMYMYMYVLKSEAPVQSRVAVGFSQFTKGIPRSFHHVYR